MTYLSRYVYMILCAGFLCGAGILHAQESPLKEETVLTFPPTTETNGNGKATPPSKTDKINLLEKLSLLCDDMLIGGKFIEFLNNNPEEKNSLEKNTNLVMSVDFKYHKKYIYRVHNTDSSVRD